MTDHSGAHDGTAAICGVSGSRTPLTCDNKGVQFSDVPLLHSVESSLVPTSPIYAL